MHINASAIEKVILFGDSLMAGYGLPKEQHLSLVLESNLVRSGLNIKVINGSVSGSTSSGGLNRAEWSLSEPGIDLIILGLGANDMLRGIQPDETERNLEEIIKSIPGSDKLHSTLFNPPDDVLPETLPLITLMFKPACLRLFSKTIDK